MEEIILSVNTVMAHDEYKLTLTDISCDSLGIKPLAWVSPENYGNYKYSFDGYGDIAYDPNLYHSMGISDAVHQKLRDLSQNSNIHKDTITNLSNLVKYLDKNGSDLDYNIDCYHPADKTYYLIISSTDVAIPSILATQKKYLTYVYGICDTLAEANELIGKINYDRIIDEILPLINVNTPSPVLSMNLINQACHNPYLKNININRLIALLMLKIRTPMMCDPYTNAASVSTDDIIGKLRAIDGSLNIITATQKMLMNSPRYHKRFMFTPVYNDKYTAPAEVINEFVTINDPQYHKAVYPIINPKTQIMLTSPIDDSNVAKSYMNPKPLNEEYPNLFKGWGYKTHPLQNSPTIPIENDPEENVNDDYSTNMEDNDMGD